LPFLNRTAAILAAVLVASCRQFLISIKSLFNKGFGGQDARRTAAKMAALHLNIDFEICS
jgi:hypothetical protein